jgi:DNA repair exonuclease SbcCD ATPase subunit
MIIFESIRWKNFLSTGNSFTEIKFNKSPNTLIVGHNGAGKSTILDALTFSLFGKPFRKVNKGQLLNSINNAEGLVEIKFTIGKKKYKVIRGIKPNIFEIYCNDTLMNQDAAARDYQEILEKNILKMNFKSFTQIVILGSASFVPFMQLSASDRRAIIEDLLDIQIFSSMNTLVKQKITELKDNTTKTKYEMELTAEKIKMQKQAIEEHKKHNDTEIEKKKLEITESISQIEKTTNAIELIQKHIDVLNKKIADHESVERKTKKLIQLESKLETRIKKIEKEEKFYEENHDCPTCKQSIADSFRRSQLDGINKTKREVGTAIEDIEAQIQKTNARLEEIKKIIKHIQEHNSEIIKHNTSVAAINKYVSKLNNEIQDLASKKDTLTNDNSALKILKEELGVLVSKQEELSNEKNYYDFAINLLKDGGIKTKIIRQYLPIMNKLINKYLTSMDSFINFNINENFEETIKSRHRDDFSYHNFSEGEKMRIDLAILFTWRQIAKMKNSTNTNLLILDEVFDSSLDGAGTEEFLKLMQTMGNDTNVFVISHKGDQLFDKFRSVIRFEKKNNFSIMNKG